MRLHDLFDGFVNEEKQHEYYKRFGVNREDPGTFKAGDVVKLVTGGPLMTVSRWSHGWYSCMWFDECTLHEGLFSPETLAK